MNILIINGSPAGENSITLQTAEYLKILFPEHHWETLHVGQRIRSIEKDFSPSEEALEKAELLLFCYPVYTFLVPAQLHRFLELMKESGMDYSKKYASQISTSKHFYDITAHRFIEDICNDLNLKYIKGLSADMEDILTSEGRKQAKSFFRFVLWNMKNDWREPSYAVASRKRMAGSDSAVGMNSAVGMEPTVGMNSAVTADAPVFIPGIASDPVSSSEKSLLNAAVVTDYDPACPPEGLRAMIDQFVKRLPGNCEIINLREFPFSGGCLGCFHCASDGKCIYKDGFDDFLRSHINSADAVVYAFTIKDHSMGFRMKLYDDRQFCNGHRTVTMGKPVGYLVDGDLSREENLRTLIEARAQVGGNFLAGIATDTVDPDGEIDRLAATLAYTIVHKYRQPQNFYGVGGLKIFRDLIFEMQGLMKADHRFYKKHGFYDFPQKKKTRIAAMYLVSALMNNETLRKKSGLSMTDGMMLQYKKVLEKVRREHSL